MPLLGRSFLRLVIGRSRHVAEPRPEQKRGSNAQRRFENLIRRNRWPDFYGSLGSRTATAIVVHGAPFQGLRGEGRHISAAGSRETRDGICEDRYRCYHLAEQAIDSGLLYRVRKLGIHEPNVARYADALRSS